MTTPQRLLLLICLALAVGAAQACKCVQPMMPAGHFERARTVITGVVETVEPVAGAMKATLRIERKWKKAPTGPITVFTDGTCAVPFVAGQHYLLYLQPLSPSTYATDRCSGSANVKSSQRALRWLERRASAASTH